MVSSLWVISDSLGGYLGDTFGSMAYDKYGFETGTSIMMSTMLVSVVLCLVYIALPGHRSSVWGSQASIVYIEDKPFQARIFKPKDI